MERNIIQLNSITETHQLLGLPKPKHPHVSFFRHRDIGVTAEMGEVYFSLNMYLIALKDNVGGSMDYGRNKYDFQEGTLVCIGPNQVFSSNYQYKEDSDDWMLLFSSEFILESSLGKTIHDYNFFSYESDEALHLSDDEKKEISDLATRIEKESSQNIDKHTQDIILINLESLLRYTKRFYERQFYTRVNFNKGYVVDFERLLREYYSVKNEVTSVPTVAGCAKILNISAPYLSDLLKTETGKTAKEHIDFYVLKKAKMLLINTRNENISEIAYRLGFEYPNHFSKFFKNKTGLTPKEYIHISIC
jgi:AraC-like DNA-binding protein